MRTPGPKAAAAHNYCGPPLSWPAVVAGALWVSGPQDRGGSRTGDFPAAQEAASAGRGAPGASAVAASKRPSQGGAERDRVGPSEAERGRTGPSAAEFRPGGPERSRAGPSAGRE